MPRFGCTMIRAPPLAKPATTRIGTPEARPAVAASAAEALMSISPAMMAGLMSMPLAKNRSSIFRLYFGASSFM